MEDELIFDALINLNKISVFIDHNDQTTYVNIDWQKLALILDFT